MKIAILGYSGSGKSTCAKQLAQFYNILVLYLDQIYFLPNWVERDRKEAIQVVINFMNQENWILDGNYPSFVQEERVQKADLILYFNFPRITCLIGVIRRYLANLHQTRESMAAGCEEKLDLEFIKWVLYDGRIKETRQRYKQICDQYRHKTHIFTSHKQVAKFLASLKEESI